MQNREGTTPEARILADLNMTHDEIAAVLRLERIKALAPAMASLLKRLEWDRFEVDDGGELRSSCPRCEHFQGEGHGEGCELAAILREIDSPTVPLVKLGRGDYTREIAG